MVHPLKRLLVGEPLATAQAAHERLSKRVALAVFSSDALSSVAYATEEVLLVLAVAAAATGNASFGYVIPISVAIVVLLWLVGLSYRQTIYAYPSGGGAYIVAKENLSTFAGLVAAAALLVDYVLTVAVSTSAGVAAITSAAQGTEFAWLDNHKTTLCLLAIALITLANLRGVRESGALFSIPAYVFIVSFMAMIVCGGVQYAFYGAPPAPAPTDLKIAEGYDPSRYTGLTLFLLLSAFSGGCTAMTGVEAISNGVPAFRKPESRNAATTLLWMVILLTVMFLGTSVLAHIYQVRPSEKETVISQFARMIFTGWPGSLSWLGWAAYYLVQGATAAILLLAANTSFADFPRLASLMARDRYLPAQLSNLGDRLVFSNGILLLALFAAILVWSFGGDTSRLIPLYAIGVFLSFTLSQAGMVLHWQREGRGGREVAAGDQATSRPGGHQLSMLINGLGAVATAVVTVVFIMTKFVHGAWIVVVVIPLLVVLFEAIHHHYNWVESRLALGEARLLGPRHNTVLIPLARVHQGLIPALDYASSLSGDVEAVYVEVDPARTPAVQEDWAKLGTTVPLKVLPSPYRSFVGRFLQYVNEVDYRRGDDVVTVLLPEFVPPSWWQQLLHNQTIFRLKAALLYRPGIVVTSVPYHL